MAGLIGGTVDEEIFRELAAAVSDLDFTSFTDTLRLLGEHDAWDVLPTVRVPATVIVADRDLMTPVESASRMSALMGDARLVVVPGCTHWAPVERPERINEELDALIARCGAW